MGPPVDATPSSTSSILSTQNQHPASNKPVFINFMIYVIENNHAYHTKKIPSPCDAPLSIPINMGMKHDGAALPSRAAPPTPVVPQHQFTSALASTTGNRILLTLQVSKNGSRIDSQVTGGLGPVAIVSLEDFSYVTMLKLLFRSL